MQELNCCQTTGKIHGRALPYSTMSPESKARATLSKILVKKLHSTAPSQFCRSFVIARSCVVVEAVIGPFIDVGRVVHVIRFQRGFECRPSGVDAVVQA